PPNRLGRVARRPVTRLAHTKRAALRPLRSTAGTTRPTWQSSPIMRQTHVWQSLILAGHGLFGLCRRFCTIVDLQQCGQMLAGVLIGHEINRPVGHDHMETLWMATSQEAGRVAIIAERDIFWLCPGNATLRFDEQQRIARAIGN